MQSVMGLIKPMRLSTYRSNTTPASEAKLAAVEIRVSSLSFDAGKRQG